MNRLLCRVCGPTRSFRAPGGLRRTLRLALMLTLAFIGGIAAAGESCLSCHAAETSGLAQQHRFADAPCTPCHAGAPDAGTEEAAHRGLIRRPGELADSVRACGGCHATQVNWVMQSPMSTGARIVAATRRLFGEAAGPPGSDHMRALGHGAADSLLRKLCASCHLAQAQSGEGEDPVHARGGGCLACHLSAKTDGDGHRRLDTATGDRHCFGCHSRSGRISLNYAGLGEVTGYDPGRGDTRLARLGDGRLVEHLEADVHHGAGLSCVDCHTGPGLMGAFAGEANSVDIACEDCHDNDNPRLTADAWPGSPDALRRRVPFELRKHQPFLATTRGTPLWHVELRENAEPLLYRKRDGQSLSVPQLSTDHARVTHAHQKLTCDACHAAWAPQCFGCHVDYDPDTPQWDHLDQRETTGEWRERRWDIRNEAAPLGHRPDGRIGLFVPGMIMTLEHPDLATPEFIRRFAPLHPHTSGPSRTCEDCHREPRSLGLGRGTLAAGNDGLSFAPAGHRLQDGLPADGWASLDAEPEHESGRERPLSPEEISRLFHAPLSGAR